ncbi:hypothetical protein J3A83DRAFT_3019305 [Scleroderma citrinum]
MILTDRRSLARTEMTATTSTTVLLAILPSKAKVELEGLLLDGNLRCYVVSSLWREPSVEWVLEWCSCSCNLSLLLVMPRLSFPEKGSYIGKFQHETTAGTPKDGHSAPLEVPPRVVFDPKQESRLWRNVDLRLMPMIALMYLLCFMDRGKSLIC